MTTRSGKRTGTWARYALALVAIVAAAGLVVAGGAREAKAAGNTLSWGSTAYSVVEGNTFSLLINRTPTGSQVSPTLTITPGTATENVDYTLLFGTNPTLVFQVGVGQYTFSIPTIDNGTAQPARSFTVTLNAPGETVTAPATITLTILDNDAAAQYSFASPATSFLESAGTVTVDVVRSGSNSGTDVVSCSQTGGSATLATDYTFGAQTITFGPGETTKTCALTILQDTTVDVGETVILSLSVISGFTGGAGTNPTTTVTITDDDAASVQWAATNFNVTEGNSLTSTVTISATRTGDLTGAASVPWSAANGTATTGDSDFIAGAGTFAWGGGVGGIQTATVTINGDTTPENDETIALSFGSPTGVVIGTPNTATITILNDDSVSSLSFSATNYTVTEASTTVTVTVNRSGTTSGTVGVSYATSDGTALAGSDYTSASGLLSFGTGVTTQTFSVTILNDALAEPTQSLNLTLSSATGGATLGSPSTATITIYDDEAGGPTITSLSPASGPIGGGNTVIITGTNLSGATLVTFGGVSASLVTISSTTITVTAPPAPGSFAQTVNVVVTTPVGTSSIAGFADDYTYTGGPTVSSLSPNSGPTSGVTFVTITGTGFTPTGMTVTFGGTSATFSYTSSTLMTAVSPAHSAGVVDVIVTTPGGVSPNTALDDFTYTGTSAPVITSISPTSGPIGTVVTVSGSGFTGASVVTVGGVSASFTVVSDSTITVTVPASTPGGTVDIRVTTAGGTSANVTADNFTNTSSSGLTTTYTLYFRWTLIAWTGIDNLSAYNAVRGIETGTANPNTNDVSGQVLTIWYWDAAAQKYMGYFVGFENVPGANDFTTMRRGVSYWVAVNSSTTSWTVLLGQ